MVTIDRPGWSIETLTQLLSETETSCPEFKGRGGHPLLICEKDIVTLSNSSVDAPLNSIFKIKRIMVNDQYLHLNIDTPSELINLNNFIESIETNTG